MRFTARLFPVIGALVSPLAAAPTLAQTPSSAFQHIDGDHDGRITRSEFDAARSAAFARADADHDGKLSLGELRALAAQTGSAAQGRPSREQLEKLRRIDRNGDRAIDAGEFAALSERSFAKLDANGDGSVTSEESGALARALGLDG